MANQTGGSDGDGDSDDEQFRFLYPSRRTLLKVGGATAGAAAIGGAGLVAGQEDDDDEGDDDGDAGDDGGSTGSDALLDDLVDPTWGYPLAVDEAEGVSVEHTVDVTVIPGEGEHEGFPAEPDESAPGSFIEIGAEFVFDPVGLAVEPGDLVEFQCLEGLHTVSAFTELAEPGLELPRRVPEGVPPFTSPPLTPGQSWVYQFTEPGVYDYFCFPHLGLGMVARIVVYDPEEDDLSSDEFAVAPPEGLFPNDVDVLTSEELEPQAIVDAGEVAWADLSLESPSAGEPTDDDGTETSDGEETETPEGEETETPEGEETEEPVETESGP
ncbi:cupredoxin domain-containing protein [Halobaculum limi]|uniref:cupredoxin domain-containing protein n=1 Tax=Halobaculum limi TaxID=3031916 RepID=UPI002405303F|nr:plastocyanin/azurin family copper-binding protein [Halobaculum sp. YSMS11]